MVEQKIADEYTKWQMRCPVHLSIGQEIVSACLQTIWRINDYVVRSQTCTLSCKKWIIKKNDCRNLWQINWMFFTSKTFMHLIDKTNGFMGSTAIVANTIPVGVGLGLFSKYKKKKSLSFICMQM